MTQNKDHSAAPNPGTYAHCRARKLAWVPTGDDYTECVTHQAQTCPHRLNCGDYCLCFHPNRLQIVAHTVAAGP